METEITESNRLIAEFMGFETGGYTLKEDGSHDYYYQVIIPCPSGSPYNNYEDRSHKVESMEFHYCWDWLMPVVEKIESLGNQLAIFNNVAAIANQKQPNLFSEAFKGETKLEATYKAVVEFIKWYNSHKEATK